jgi:dihydrofolate reductase
MGDVVVTEFITLDGVIEDPGGAEQSERGGWAFQFDRGAEGDRFKLEELMASDAQLLGRVTYEGFAAAWPQMNDDDFGRKMNSMPKYVVSTTLEHAGWTSSTVLRGGDALADEVAQLQERYAGDILVAGSASLVRSLVAADLVDQLRLMVFPVVLGAGKRLFADGGAAASMRLELVDSKQSADVAILTLSRARRP